MLAAVGAALALAHEAWAAAVASTHPPATPWRVLLTVKEPSGIDRRAEPVTSGIPLPPGVATNPAGLTLISVEHRAVVPCQFTPLSRWPDSSLKWVLLDFLCDVPAHRARRFILAAAAGNTQPAVPASVTENGDYVVLQSGPLAVTIHRKQGTLVEEIRWNGERETLRGGPWEAVLEVEKNKVYRSRWGTPTEVKVEEAGPIRACVRMRGPFVDAEGQGIYGGRVGYEARLTVWAGKPHLQVAFTLCNDGAYGFKALPRKAQWLHLRSLRLELPMAEPVSGEGPSEGRCSAGGFPLENKAETTFMQWFQYPVSNPLIGRQYASSDADREREARANRTESWKGYYYLVECEGRAVSAGETLEGWAGLYRRERPVLHAHLRRFRENFPAGFGVKRDGVVVWLLPRGGFWPRIAAAAARGTYQFEGHRHKTWTVRMRFGDTGAAAAAEQEAFEHPLFAWAPLEAYQAADAVWPLATPGCPTPDAETAEAMQRYERLQRAKVYVSEGDPAWWPDPTARPPVWDPWRKVSILSLRERCPESLCGFMNFGDLPWGFGYCSLFYDWPYAMALQALRFGDQTMLELCGDMVAHRCDIDRGPGFQMYEKGHHGDYTRKDVNKRYAGEFTPRGSHSWGRGLLLYWVLTGERRALETARQNAQAYERQWQKKLKEPVLDVPEYRTVGWALDQWLALYEYAGDLRYRALAATLFRRSLLAMEARQGSRGHIVPQEKQSSQFTAFIIEPVARLHRITEQPEVAAFLRRVLDWHRKVTLVDGRMIRGQYAPLRFLVHGNADAAKMDPEDRDPLDVNRLYAWMFADGYAYLYTVFQRPEDLELARRLFRDSVFYYGVEGALMDPEARTPLGYHFRGHVVINAAKVHAWTGRYHHLYLTVEERIGKKAP